MTIYQRVSQVRRCLSFLILLKFKDNVGVLLKKIVFDGKEMTENINNSSETELTSLEDPLNVHRTISNESNHVSEIPNIINDENVIFATGQGKKLVSILSDGFCEEQAFPYLLPKSIFRYNAPREIPISPARYFNQRLLSFNQCFASDADYIFFSQVCA